MLTGNILVLYKYSCTLEFELDKCEYCATQEISCLHLKQTYKHEHKSEKSAVYFRGNQVHFKYINNYATGPAEICHYLFQNY